MARANWTGALSFGLVNIRVKLFSATEQKDVRFRQFQEGTGQRIRYKRVAEETGEEVPYEDIVKGYEVEKGRYVIVTPEELEASLAVARKAGPPTWSRRAGVATWVGSTGTGPGSGSMTRPSAAAFPGDRHEQGRADRGPRGGVVTAGPVCSPCREGWEHCDHAAIEHADGSVECTGDYSCALGPELHEAAVPCVELVSGCGCAPESGQKRVERTRVGKKPTTGANPETRVQG